MNEYERLGRLYHDYATLREEYSKLLALVARIQAGEVDPQRVAILPGDAWEIRPVAGPAPAAPAEKE